MSVVSISNTTGVIDKEKVNMAAVIHCKETNKMEYKYKSYDPNEWQFYQFYLHLQKLPNFSGLRPTAVVESSVYTISNESRGGG